MGECDTRFRGSSRIRPTSAQNPRSSANPFSIPTNVELFGRREDEKLRIEEERRSIQSMTLMQRASLLSPRVPDCIVRDSQKATRPVTTLATRSAVDESFHNIMEKKQMQSKRMAEFIQQKREVYIVQMLIDRKNREINKIHERITQSEKSLEDVEAKLTENKSLFKIASAKVESDLAKARMAMESAVRVRVEKQKEVKMKTTANDIMRSEILKNQESMEFLVMCQKFLLQLTPPGEDLMTYYSDPSVLLSKMEEIEGDNFSIIQHMNEIEQLVDRGVTDVNDELKKTAELIEKAQRDLDRIQEVEEFDWPSPSSEAQDAELAAIQGLVRKAFMKCFKKESDSSSIAQLEKIENELENLYRQIKKIDPKFVHEKQSIRDKERREKLKRDRQEKEAQEQRMKKEQAIERAKKPIKKKTGRPLYPRTKLMKVRKEDDDRTWLLRQEQERVEKLLYGPLHG